MNIETDENNTFQKVTKKQLSRAHDIFIVHNSQELNCINNLLRTTIIGTKHVYTIRRKDSVRLLCKKKNKESFDILRCTRCAAI